MCNFFSVISNGDGKVYYFDWGLRKKVLNKELSYEPDSHTSIADYYGFKGADEDRLNKYEYNPLTKKFTIDQLNTKDDSTLVEKFCNELDFKTIVPALKIKDIIHPFTINPPAVITSEHIDLLRKWASVWASVGDSVGDSVRASVWASVGDSVGDSVRASVGASAGDSVRASVWASVGASVGDSVWASVWASVGDFFELEKWQNVEHEKGEYPFQASVNLWALGLFPSFDGKAWRLHSKTGVEWEGTL